MTRSFSTKDPDKKKCREKPVILIVAEGNNQTEKNYFNSFRQSNGKYVLYVHGTGGPTDPQHMKEKLEALWSQYDMSADNGDFGYIVLDLDCGKDNKANTIKSLKKDLGRHISFIVSNPCFEVWFLLHYRNSTRSFMDSGKAIEELKKYIPDYEKKLDVSKDIAGYFNKALGDADRINKVYESENRDWPSNECNPRTDVPIIFHVLQKIERG